MSRSLFDVERFDVPGADISLLHDAVKDADKLFDQILQGTPWQQQEITVFNRHMPMPRLTCWMGEASYTYSKLKNEPAPWTAPVLQVREQVTELTRENFNGVLLNLYRDGQDSMGWHADNEASLGSEPIIPSVNLGATRRMRFKPRKGEPGETFGVDLPHGSILLMRGKTQENWLHAVTKTAKSTGPRINLTYRRVVSESAS